MTVYVLRNNELVVKRKIEAEIPPDFTQFPTPMISRFEAMASPVDGRTISSWRERDRDMQQAGCVDPRDLPRGPFEQRERENARRQQLDAAERSDET